MKLQAGTHIAKFFLVAETTEAPVSNSKTKLSFEASIQEMLKATSLIDDK